MSRICLILIAGLDQKLLSGGCGALSFPHIGSINPVLPAVTSPMQATLTTGVNPGVHGIVANGLYTFGNAGLQQLIDTGSFADFRRQVSFWEQSADLIQAPRFWSGRGWKTAMLFWQQSIPGRHRENAADIVLTPKPEHSPDGKTLSACWSQPAGLYAELTAQFGPFPLHHYWGPMASLPSSAWIVNSARAVWRGHRPDLQLVYVPHMDYNLQRLGPDNPAIAQDWSAVCELLKPLIDDVREDGGRAIVVGDYGITGVSRAIFPNRSLRQEGLLKTTPDAHGKLLIDFAASQAMAIVDHQIAHVYVHADAVGRAARVLRAMDGVAAVLQSPEELAAAGLGGGRCGQLVLLAQPDAWFAHDWWQADEERPQWQYSVDIHRKPGYDPRELFFDPVRKCIAQETGLVKGSHGLTPRHPRMLPALLSDAALPEGDVLPAQHVSAWITGLLGEQGRL